MCVYRRNRLLDSGDEINLGGGLWPYGDTAKVVVHSDPARRGGVLPIGLA